MMKKSNSNLSAFCCDLGHIPLSTLENSSSRSISSSTGFSSIACSGGYVSILDIVAAETLSLQTSPTLALLPVESATKSLCSKILDEVGLCIIGCGSGIYIFDMKSGTTQTSKSNRDGRVIDSQFILSKFIATHSEVKCIDAAVLKLPSTLSSIQDELQQYAIDMFSEIPNQSLPEQSFDPQPYTNDSLTTR